MNLPGKGRTKHACRQGKDCYILIVPEPKKANVPALHSPLLTTKLYLPPARAVLVRRSRLVDRLQAGLQGALTLLSAPAGSGKTTQLLSKP